MMKKGLFSFAVCVALLTPSAFAGTVQTATDNSISLYGEIKYYTGWTKRCDFMGNTAYKSDDDKVKFDSYIGATTLGIDIENKNENLEGKIEGDFSNDSNVFGLTYAYVQHNLNNGPFVLLGKTDQIGEENTFSNNDSAPAGFNGTDQVMQIRAGGSFDMGSVTITPEIAFEDIKDVLIDSGEANNINRTAFPGIGLKLSGEFKTGFGEPARIYAFYEFQHLYLSKNKNKGEESKTPYVYGAGFDLPVNIAEIQAEYIYGKGSTNYAGAVPAGDLKIPGGYYTKGNSLKARKFYAYNVEANVSPIDILNIYGGYDYVRFENHIKEAGDNAAKNTQAVFAGINLSTTKVTTLSLEWDHFKTKYYPKASNSETASANQVFLMYDYAF